MTTSHVYIVVLDMCVAHPQQTLVLENCIMISLKTSNRFRFK
uniref:Uncharacterized protein n=1 Tax=Anguilla anguilla TaxID=7936 RepID=A0A0E9WBX6_ANGAN